MAIYGAKRHTENKTEFNTGDVITLKATGRNKMTIVSFNGFKIYAKDDLSKMGMFFMEHTVELYSPVCDQQQTVSWWAD